MVEKREWTPFVVDVKAGGGMDIPAGPSNRLDRKFRSCSLDHRTHGCLGECYTTTV